MKTFDTDDNNDIYLSGNGFAFVEDIEAVSKVAENICLTQRGELRYQTTRGIPWLETIFSSIRNLPAWSAAMTTAIKKIDDVTGLTSFDYEASGNLVEYVARINTTYGETTVNV